MNQKREHKEFFLSSWSVNNKTSIYVMTFLLTVAGILSYVSLPKEEFPEIVFPQFYISTVQAGTSPKDMENIVTKQIEKHVKSIPGVKKVTSTSQQDFSSVIVEFNTDVKIPEARQRLKDKLDDATTDLPTNLTQEPKITEVDVSEFPIMNINLSGDIDLMILKKYAEDMQDKIETMKEIRRVDIIGAPEREIQINVDKYKMEAAGVTMNDISSAVQYENFTISGGLITMGNVKRSVNIPGEFKDVKELDRIVVRSSSGAVVYLNEIASIVDTIKETESFARLEGKNVITLNVVKRGGENLIDASDKIKEYVEEMTGGVLPDQVRIDITGDMSNNTRTTLHDLINTIIIGFILVTIILMFFMGATNAMFVGLSVPLSMFIAFIALEQFGYTMNMIVLFAFLLALGIVVDDAIVVIENTHRLFENGKMPIKKAAKFAAGEVFLPVFSGTMTTLAPFVPLAFWPGVMGEFMFFLPITLIMTLLASLVVAYTINPVFAVDFMKPHEPGAKVFHKGFVRVALFMGILAVLFYGLAIMGSGADPVAATLTKKATTGGVFGSGWFGMGNLVVLLFALYSLYVVVLEKVILNFQEVQWPRVQRGYEKILRVVLKGWGPTILLGSTIVLFFLSIVLTAVRNPNVVFFPSADPNFVYTYIELPIGTDQKYTDSIAKIVEKRVFAVMGDSNPIVKSIITNVSMAAGDPSQPDFIATPHKAKVTVAFVEFAHRNGVSTKMYLDSIRAVMKGIPGAVIKVDQEQGGPPVGKPINIEVAGEDFDELIATSESFLRFVDSIGVEGIEELKSDLVKTKPEIAIIIDREKANREGISTMQIQMEIRNALFGAMGQNITEGISKFRDKDDEYYIQLRFESNQRANIESLLDHKIIYRDMVMMGQIREIPLSSLVRVEYPNTLGGIKRKNQKRVITLSSNVLSGYNANEINAELKRAAKDFKVPSDVTIDFTGEQEDQQETASFLGGALLTSILLIFLILTMQFNSFSKPVIIMTEIVFSIIGVLLGFTIFSMDISILMTGVGIVALAGIVVRNGILLIEFTVELQEKEGYELFEAAVIASKTRMTPVLLTATATMLGLIPLAVGLNMDFVTLFTELNPHIFFGGDSVAFWGPLSWTMIFGLAFATFLTLVLVPSMYLLVERLKERIGWYKTHPKHPNEVDSE